MKKKNLLLILTAVTVVAAMAVGGTLAYFTSTDKADNTFTAGNVAIKLYEHEVVANTNEDTGLTTWNYALDTHEAKIETQENLYTGIYPGAVLPKDPTIKNTGSNPAYVRMKVTISHADAWVDKLGSGFDLTGIFGGFDGTKWTLAATPAVDQATNTITYIYNYDGILGAGDETGALFTTVTIPTFFDNAEMKAVGGNSRTFTLKITAEAIQSDGFYNNGQPDEAAAFTALNSQLVP